MKYRVHHFEVSMTRDQMKLDFVPQAIKRVKGALLTRALYFQEKMDITEAEIDRAVEVISNAVNKLK